MHWKECDMKGELTEKEATFLIEQNLDGESLDGLTSIGYTLRGAARALSIAYDIPEDAVLDRLKEAAERGDLKVRDPGTGLTYTPRIRRDFYERVSPDDLNSFFESQNVPYRVEVDRYTMPAAIRLLQENTGERFPELLAAVHANEIKAYAPGRYRKPIAGNPSDRSRLPRGISCGDEQIEFFGIDLDAWLDKHFPRVKFRFSQVGAGETGNGQEESPAQRRAALDITTKRGCPRLILECWDDVEKLHGPSADGRQVQKILKRKLEKNDEGPSLKTIRNQLRNLRLEKLIP
jgi:hypothetical protein